MAEKAILAQWGNPYPGREEMAMGVFMGALQHYGALKQNGELEDVQVFIHNSGSLHDQQGILILTGSAEQIDAVRASDEHKAMITKAVQGVTNMIPSNSPETSSLTRTQSISERSVRSTWGITMINSYLSPISATRFGR